MIKFPEKNNRARIGSNIRGNSKLVRRKEDLARKTAPLEKLARRHYRELRSLFPKADQRRIADIRTAVNSEWRQAGVKGARDADRAAALKRSAQKKLRRLLTREFPNYTPSRKLQQAYLRERRTLLSRTHAPVRGRLAWSDEVTRFAGAQEFTPPYTSWDAGSVHNLPEGPGTYYSGGPSSRFHDQSFAIPSIGHLINDVESDHEQAIFVTGGRWPYSVHCRASCGVSFVTPSAGRLQVSAVLRNFYSRVTMSLQDLFGLSSGDLYVSLNLCFTIIQASKLTELTVPLMRDGLISHGTDLSSVWTELDDSAPYTPWATTEHRLEANESVIVLAGSDVHIQSEMDDMHSHVKAVQWWQLQKLSIGMTE